MDFLLCCSSVKQCLARARHRQKREALHFGEEMRQIRELELYLQQQKREALHFREKMRQVRELELYLQLQKREAIGDAEKNVEADSGNRESYCECDGSVDVVSEFLELKEAVRRRREAEHSGELIKDDDDGDEDGTGSSSSSSLSPSQSYKTAQEECGGDDDCEQTGA